jgi:hypothetical protein
MRHRNRTGLSTNAALASEPIAELIIWLAMCAPVSVFLALVGVLIRAAAERCRYTQ